MFAIGGDRDFEFGRQADSSQSRPADDKMTNHAWKGRGQVT